MRPILYLTIDGVLDHIGFSQVLRVIEGLAKQGLPYVLVSMERTRDLRDQARVAAVRARLAAAGIAWTWAEYEDGAGGRQAIRNLAAFGRLAAKVAHRRRVGLIHARAYHGASIALALRASMGIPYVFDVRGLSIDERIEEGRWFTTPTRLRIGRGIEDQLYRRAAAVVTLTELHAGDAAVHRSRGARPIVVIPTCADYDEFRPGPLSSYAHVPTETVDGLRGRLVLGIVGSLNRAYLGDVAARLAARVLTRDREARLVVLSSQGDAWRRCLESAGVPMDQVLLTKAGHEAMPEWLSLVRWGLLLLTPDTVAKRAMMPTKLAEFFAAGVRPLIHGCNPEARAWVTRAGSGLVLDRVDDEALNVAADTMCAEGDPSAPARARTLTAEHFSLASGIQRYAELLRSLMR